MPTERSAEEIATNERDECQCGDYRKSHREGKPHPHTHCCFCGAYNANDPIGYAGERACHNCGHGGCGEASITPMACDSWREEISNEVAPHQGV